MKKMILMAMLMFITILFTGSVLAQELMIFPAKGQSEDQMEKDKFECYSWGKKQTGFDPMVIPKATAPPPQQQAKSGGRFVVPPAVRSPGRPLGRSPATREAMALNTVPLPEL